MTQIIRYDEELNYLMLIYVGLRKLQQVARFVLNLLTPEETMSAVYPFRPSLFPGVQRQIINYNSGPLAPLSQLVCPPNLLRDLSSKRPPPIHAN